MRPACSIDGCDRPAYVRGWCAMHYSRVRRHGDPLAHVPRQHYARAYGSDVCAIDGCDKPRRGRGWCTAHYARWRKHGDPLIVKKGGRAPGPFVPCAIDGCERRHAARGWCDMHYGRWLTHRDPMVKATGGTIAERLARYSQRAAAGPVVNGVRCLEWTGKSRTDSGYGLLWVTKKTTARAHRLAWEQANGRELRPGLFVLHACDNPACIEPAHLREGTAAENAADMVARGRHNPRRVARAEVVQLDLFGEVAA